jgi:hypothetical protein
LYAGKKVNVEALPETPVVVVRPRPPVEHIINDHAGTILEDAEPP